MSLVRVRFAPETLATNHAGLDLEASARAYRDALEQALLAAIGRAGRAIVVEVDPGARPLRVEIEGEELVSSRALERDVLDHAWVVRQMGAWAVTSLPRAP